MLLSAFFLTSGLNGGTDCLRSSAIQSMPWNQLCDCIPTSPSGPHPSLRFGDFSSSYKKGRVKERLVRVYNTRSWIFLPLRGTGCSRRKQAHKHLAGTWVADVIQRPCIPQQSCHGRVVLQIATHMLRHRDSTSRRLLSSPACSVFLAPCMRWCLHSSTATVAYLWKSQLRWNRIGARALDHPAKCYLA